MSFCAFLPLLYVRNMIYIKARTIPTRVSPSRTRIALHSSRLLYHMRAISIDIGVDPRFLHEKVSVELARIQCMHITMNFRYIMHINEENGYSSTFFSEKNYFVLYMIIF